MDFSTAVTLLAQAAGQADTGSLLFSLLPLVLIVALFYLFIMRPQKKQEKADQQMRDNLEIGDEVITNGGIVGIVFQIKDDTVVIETGGDRSKIRIKKWAIAKNETVHDDDLK